MHLYRNAQRCVPPVHPNIRQITARVERRRVVGGLISEYRRVAL